ncbi:MAG: hypothetical protein UT63_C0010G0002 [Candidatus Gottesmanbacteria bacterium GW2011_GWC2_39_8]|uniref:DUF4231 domain-containing protein n=1 Tax=Candidatus Gottesmanbacteria bacterium GW2011_GWC2_39_8 TaxID=1618450 RepID=A0A0G0Q156_9BACT|nr:MAG: hypothetical protein UT63_C0010G0002 [Candidatus Gottesmanbacteria bacterium GW2011_GWC2_39_8]
MTDQEFSEYCTGRYSRALNYYDSRAITNQWCHRIFSIYSLVISIAITPILTSSVICYEYSRIIVSILAPTIAIVTGISAIFKYHENWLNYRATWDALIHEKYWRDACVNEYKNAEDRNTLFVERVENLISQEGNNWLARQTSKEKNTGK